VFLEEGEILFLKGSRPMMFEVRPKAFSNIRIQDRNTLLDAENAMNL
jgi:hypothetical protein